MIKGMVMLALCIIVSSNLNATVINKENCRKVAKQIKHIESQMRQGYTVKKGERLMKRLRVLKKRRYACHKARLPTK